MVVTDNEINVYYVSKDYGDVLKTCGRWEVEFTEYYETQQLCTKAVEKELAEMACHTSKLRYLANGCGTACFYVKPNDIRAQRKLLKFLIHNNIIPRNDKGMLKNIPFLFEENSNSDYHFTKEYHLSDFIKL